MIIARGSTPATRTAVRLAALAANVLVAWPAAAQPELSDAFRRWFATDRAVTCVDPDGRGRRCSISEAEHISVVEDPAGERAVVFITYLPDPTAIGDATRIAAAVFRRDAGGWRLARILRASAPCRPAR